MFFSGDHRNRKGINLGGAKTRLDKDKLLQATQAERRQRELERLKVKSATKIQAFYRGRLSASATKSVWRKELDALLVAMNNRNEINVVDLIKSMRIFLAVYSPTVDKERLGGMVTVLGKPGERMLAVILPFAFEEYRNIWLFQMTKFLDNCLSSFHSLDRNDPLTSHICHLLVYIFDEPSYRHLPETVRHNVILSLSSTLLNRGYYRHLGEAIAKDRSPSFVSLIVKLSVKPWTVLLSTEYEQKLAQEFTYFLSFPQVNELPETLCKELQAGLPRLYLAKLWAAASEVCPEIQRCAAEEQVLRASSLVSTFVKMLRHDLNQLSSHDLDDDDDVDDDENNALHAASPATPFIVSIQSSETITANLQIIFDFPLMRQIANRIVNTPLADGGLLSFSSVLMAMLCRRKSKRVELLDGLIFSLQSTIFQKLLKNIVFPKGVYAINYTSNTFLLLSELLDRLLLTIDDRELVGGTWGFSKGDIANVAIHVKDILFDAYWHDSNNELVLHDSMLSKSYILERLKNLLQHLYLRNSRCQFCLPDMWLANEDIDINTFLTWVPTDDMIISTDANARVMSILKHIPFVLSFDARVRVFREWIRRDKEKIVSLHLSDAQNWLQPISRVTIRRECVFEDGFKQLSHLASKLKGRIAITFVSDQGLTEAGIDGGGVFKEFLTSLTREAFDPKFGLFAFSSDNCMFPSPAIANQELSLRYLEFFGRIVGKALYEGILIDIAFSKFFLTKWLGRQSYLDDLPSLDEQLANGLHNLKMHKGNIEQDFSLNFTVTEEFHGKRFSVDLIPNGSQTPVTNENVIRYIYLVAHFKLNRRISNQCRAFFNGLSNLIDPSWLRIFNEEELQTLLGGAYIPIDLKDLQKNVTYAGDFHEQHPTIVHFWEVLNEMSEEQLRAFLKFVTSCSRPPLLGFSELQPGFCLRQAGYEEDRLPTASTCVNLLKLPPYSSKNLLREKLLYAINAEAGFELS
ncbi:hypothetical protein HDV05_001303 [Chytridiales sp. JEL 0842]|nr:hypothetical protein HDV05_001303 [Chytridiales sp. JEL 0842]